jgi:hypothetical protein
MRSGFLFPLRLHSYQEKQDQRCSHQERTPERAGVFRKVEGMWSDG